MTTGLAAATTTAVAVATVLFTMVVFGDNMGIVMDEFMGIEDELLPMSVAIGKAELSAFIKVDELSAVVAFIE